MNITKAIIPVAGWGTRRLPITKTIEKCMLPIGNRPVVDYVVQDCIKAGITDIFFVISKHNTQLQNYYSSNLELEQYLERNNKKDQIASITPPNVNFHYIVQPDDKKYGTAIPVGLAIPFIEKDESVVVLMGDDCIYRKDGQSEVKSLIESAGKNCAMIGVQIPKKDVSRYGVIRTNDNNEFIEIVEKPKVDEAPSDIINVSKYVFNYKMLKYIKEYADKANPKGEYVITEPINHFIEDGGKLTVVESKGVYLDSGTVQGWLNANKVIVEEMK